MSKRAVEELKKLKSYNEDLCDTARIEDDGEVNNEMITIKVDHPKFDTDNHPLVVGLPYKGNYSETLSLLPQFELISVSVDLSEAREVMGAGTAVLVMSVRGGAVTQSDWGENCGDRVVQFLTPQSLALIPTLSARILVGSEGNIDIRWSSAS